jgi:trk system potassium uptake protein TrkH
MLTINYKSLVRIASLILIIISVFFSLCIIVALLHDESVLPFAWSAGLTLVPGAVLAILFPGFVHERVSIRDGYLAVTLSWILLTACGTLPYLFSGTISSFPHAWFESTSGFTTTGASILPEVESLPRSILFWRSLTHWIGGLGIILLVIIILPRLKVGGYSLFTLESSVKQKILPKTKSVAFTFLTIYLVISIAEVLFLLLGGLDLFESLCITFGTVATGGFSIRNSSLATYTPYLQYVIAIFMFLSATSYVIYYLIINKEFKKIKQNDELWFYIFFVTASVVFVTLLLNFTVERNLGTAFRHSFFQVIAQVTTTGFATTDYMKWPEIGWAFMFILLFAGGCTGSTTGGIKMARHLITVKNIRGVILRLFHPNVIIPVKLNRKIVPDNLNVMVLLFIFIFILIVLAGGFLIALSGIPVSEAIAASASAMANVGPGLGTSGNMGNYAEYNGFAIVLMPVLMIIGRLEVFTFLAIFSLSFWKR